VKLPLHNICPHSRSTELQTRRRRRVLLGADRVFGASSLFVERYIASPSVRTTIPALLAGFAMQ